MRNALLAVLAVFLVISFTSVMDAQQVQGTYKTITIFGTAAGDTSVNEGFDTTTAFQVGAHEIVSFDIYSLDKVNLLNVHVMKQEEGKSGYTVIDSVVAWNGSTNAALNRKEFMLRDGVVNKLPGLRASFKLRPQFAGTGNDNARVYVRVHYGGQ